MFEAASAKYALLLAVVVFYGYSIPKIVRDRTRILAVAKHTFIDSVRQKILLVPLLFMGVVIGMSLFSAVYREEARARIVAASSLWALTVIGMVAAILISARGIPDDISYRTIYSVITKPVRRSSYLTGKILGFSAVSLAILAIMGIVSLALIRWVGRNAPLEARRTVGGGQLSITGAGIENRDGRRWIVHEPGSALKWAIVGMPELTRDEVALVKLRFKGKPADPAAPMPVQVEFKNADDHSRYKRIDDVRESKETVVDLPGGFVVKGRLDVIVAPLNGSDAIEEDPKSVRISAAGKEYGVETVLRRPNSWATWRFSKLPVLSMADTLTLRICLWAEGAGKDDFIVGRVRVNPRGGVGPPVDVKMTNGKPVDIELSARGIVVDGNPVSIEEPGPAYFSGLLGRIGDDPARILDIAVLPQRIGDSYQMDPSAVTLSVRGADLEADRVLPEGYGLVPTAHTYWISRALKRTATWSFTDLPVASLPRDRVTAEAHVRIGKARSIDIDMSIVSPSSPEPGEDIAVHAVRDDPYRVAAKPVEFSFERSRISEDGGVDVVISRKDPDAMLGLPHEGCIVLYARPGSFDANYCTAVIVIFFQLVLITAISVASSTSMSWPVSILISFFVFFCGHIIDIMRNAAQILETPGGHHHGPAHDPETVMLVFNKVIEVVLGLLSYILPDFRRFEVAEDVINSRAISGISITGAIIYSATYVAIAYVVAYVLFRRREIE